VAGTSELTSGGGDYRAFLWTRTGGIQRLGTLGGFTSAEDINDAGLIAGRSTNTDGFEHAVVWTINRERTILIDIKPGSETNPIKLSSTGQAVIPVAIFTTDDADASLIDVGSIVLGKTPVAERTGGTPYATRGDEDGDGDVDLLVHFDRAALIDTGDLSTTTTELVLTGRLMGGIGVRGRDMVRVIP
jgi:hypothetical protein